MFGGGSSGVRSFAVLLDNPVRSYFAGQQVTGRLILDLERERKTSGIKLNFVGRADVKWTEHHTVSTGTGSNRRTRTETRTISDREVYFDQKVYVVGRSGGPEIVVPPGLQQFPISFQLPMGIPSSFKGRYGNIHYTVSATIKKSWGFDKTTTTPFTVNGIVDLNTIPGAHMPLQFSKDKHLGCCCCKDGPISFVFKLNRRGFVPGEAFGFMIEMDNQSSKPIPRIQAKLKRHVSFHARGKSKHDTETVATINGPGVGAHETEIWRANPDVAVVPPIPPTNLAGCRIIRVEYSIHVEMEVPSGFNLKGSTEIIVGTIPFRDTFAQIRPYYPQPVPVPAPAAVPLEPTFPMQPSAAPSAPPFSVAGYPDLPPPSYQDAFTGELPTYSEACGDEADGAEGDGDQKQKEIPFDPNFVPKYATYGWMSATAPSDGGP